MIGVATYGDRAEFVTDSLSYSPGLRTLGRTSKCDMLPHLDAATLAQGLSTFSREARYGINVVAAHVETFDELRSRAPDCVRDSWRELSKVQSVEAQDARFFLVGYSEEAGEFVADGLFLENDFKPRLLGPTYLLPTPWQYRPHAWEVDAWRERGTAELHEWQARPSAPLPESPDAWIALIQGCRDRAQSSLLTHPVGGRILHTSLRRGQQVTSLVHEYDTTVEERLSVVHYTLHPLAQVRACYCGSGRMYIRCHLRAHLDEPCLCRSEKPLRECCLLPSVEIPRYRAELDQAASRPD